MTVTITDISSDLGEIYDAIEGGTTAVKSILGRAQSFVSSISAGSVDHDTVIRPLTDAMCANQVIGGVDSVNKTIGTLSVGNKDMNSMRGYFKDEAKKAAFIHGYSLDGLNIIFQNSAAQ